MGTLDRRGVGQITDEVPRAPADVVRRALLDRALPDLRQGIEGLNARLEGLPGYYASKWQLTRIRAEARQEEARVAGESVGSLNDYHDHSYRQLARVTRRKLGVMRRFLLDLAEVADQTPLSAGERHVIDELVAEVDALDGHYDDLELVRHASLHVRDCLVHVDDLEALVRHAMAGRG